MFLSDTHEVPASRFIVCGISPVFYRHMFKSIEAYIFRIVNTSSFCKKRTSQIQVILLKTSTTPSCSGPLPTHRIQRHLVPGAVYSSSLHLCSFKECHIYVRPQPSTIFKVKSNNCKRIHTSALINGSCRMVSVYRSTAINFSCLKKDFRLYDR